MKRMIYTLLTLLVAASCQVYDKEGSVVDSISLCRYADTKFVESVMLPTELLELCLDFDSYLLLSEEDRKQDYRFFGNVGYLDDHTYTVHGYYDGYVYMTVCTAGKSIRQEDAQWRILSATVSSTSYSGQFIAAYDVNLPAEVMVRMQDPASSVWTMSFLDRPALEFTLNGVEEDLYDWNVTLHREEKSSGVIWAELKTGEGGMRIQERWRVAERGKENIYEGQFLVNIYNGDALLDYCSMTFRPGFTTSYRTSR